MTTYEQAFNRLQQISESLQSGDLGLDQSIKLFEESIALSKFCLDKLSETEGKIQVFKGELTNLKPMDETDK